ncbi:MAG: radical SAM protein [Thermoplasmata archaeon]|nr:MAG: radical SAM protein [Thermoplasmata archaeon]
MATDEDVGRLKAEMISAGRVKVPRDLLAGYRLSRSTAGPGAGGTSVALAWVSTDGREHHVKLGVAPDDGTEAPLALVEAGSGELEIRRADGKVLARDVRLLPIVMHAPDQAFINLSGECVYECAFCNTHRMEPGRRKDVTPERWVELVLEAYRRSPFAALAITSVASPDHEAMMRAYETVISGVLAQVPDLAVGVEPYVQTPADIERLHEVGATEIKINVQTPDPDILERICPGWELKRQYDMLEEAVAVFGRGRVTTNIILGLGEIDTDVASAIDRLGRMGVIPTIRVVRINDGNRKDLERALGHPVEPVPVDRHVRMAHLLRDLMDTHGLDARGMESMCHKCGCCDLEPGQDV